MKLSKIVSSRNLGLLILAASVNFGVYYGGRVIGGPKRHFVMTTSIDESIPLMPWMVTIYIGCYLFWIVNYILAARFNGEAEKQFIAAHILGEIVCLAFFVFLPTTMQRPEIIGSGIFEKGLQFVYRADAADNLFPSIHCFVSWLCWIGVRKNDRIPAWYRGLSLILAVSVCVSTLTVKQHVIADAAAGIILAESAYLAAGAFFQRRGSIS